MNRRLITSVLVAAATFAFASTAAVAADPAPTSKPPAGMSGMGDMSKHHGMAGGDMQGMKGMMGMMNSCHSMMAKGKASGDPSMPQLPPGNEKLEFQMHAEMMQKMGEIAARYADRIKEAQ